MNLRVILIAAVAVLPLAGWAVSKELSGRQWLQQVPPLPDSASSAYAQWIDDNHSLKPGAGFKTVEDGLAEVGKDQATATMASPQLQQQAALTVADRKNSERAYASTTGC